MATIINNLGRVLRDLGDLSGAQAAFERALTINEAVYGPTHPEVARAVNNLGTILRDLGDLAGARSVYDQALQHQDIAVFLSYAHEDEALRDELAKHLRLLERQGIITAWHDRRISPGGEWAGTIDAHLETAQIILFLVSANFLASDYSYDTEVQRAIKRHEAGAARMIPIILRPVDWQSAPFSRLQALPQDARPITSWANQDEAFLDVARGIRAVAEEMARSSTALSTGEYSRATYAPSTQESPGLEQAEQAITLAKENQRQELSLTRFKYKRVTRISPPTHSAATLGPE